MNDFKYEIKNIKGLSCPSKFLLTINNIQICFANSKRSFANVLNYASTLNEEALQDKKIKKIIRKALEV